MQIFPPRKNQVQLAEYPLAHASPPSAQRAKPVSVAEDEGAEQASTHPSQMEDEGDVDLDDIDVSERVSIILEGLRGDAVSIARDIGLSALLLPDGIDHVIEQIRWQAFPLQSEQASELFRQGQLITGPLATQQGEPMLSYIAVRKRWWSILRELDPVIRLSEPMRANLLVELSGLLTLMTKTAARSHTVEEYARVWCNIKALFI